MSSTADEPQRTHVVDASGPIAEDLFCWTCGYNLRGLTSPRCPECGTVVDDAQLRTASIPWVHREEMGWLRAYCATIFFVMFRQKSFCAEMAREVSYSQSQIFRWTTVALAMIPVVIASLILWASAYARILPTSLGRVSESIEDPTFLGTINLIIFSVLLVTTGAPSRFFHPSSLSVGAQNRAIALSYYACGAFAVTVIPVTAALLAFVLQRFSHLNLLATCLALTLPIGQFLVWWIDLIHLSRRLTPHNPWRPLLIAFALPAVCLAEVLILVGIPVVIWSYGSIAIRNW